MERSWGPGAQGYGLLRPGEPGGDKFRGEQYLGGEESHKEICLPPRKMAAFKHLSGAGGPGQRAELPWVITVARVWRLGGKRGGMGPQNLFVPPPRGGPFAGSAVPCLPSQPASPKPRASSPWTLTPVYKHSPGAGWGRPECRLAGWGKAARFGGRHQQRGTRSWCERAGPAAGKD